MTKNPDKAAFNELIERSAHKAAKWIRAPDGTVYAWPAEEMFHAQAAALVGAETYEKGIAVPKEVTEAPR